MMRSRPVREDVVKKLQREGLSGELAARDGERTGYRCEYCDLDFLASADNYRMWDRDHIVPKSRCGGDDPDNLVHCCLPCNRFFKGTWDPRCKAGRDATRDELIEAVRVHVFEQRTTKLKEVIRFREIVQPRP